MELFDWERAHAKIVSETLGFGGTADIICRFKGGVWVGDWKTSTRIDRIRHAMQGVAYMALVQNECVWVAEDTIATKAAAKAHGIDPNDCPEVEVDGVFIARPDRLETAFEHYEVPTSQIGPLWQMFKGCLGLLEQQREFKRAMRAA